MCIQKIWLSIQHPILGSLHSAYYILCCTFYITLCIPFLNGLFVQVCITHPNVLCIVFCTMHPTKNALFWIVDQVFCIVHVFLCILKCYPYNYTHNTIANWMDPSLLNVAHFILISQYCIPHFAFCILRSVLSTFFFHSVFFHSVHHSILYSVLHTAKDDN